MDTSFTSRRRGLTTKPLLASKGVTSEEGRFRQSKEEKLGPSLEEELSHRRVLGQADRMARTWSGRFDWSLNQREALFPVPFFFLAGLLLLWLGFPLLFVIKFRKLPLIYEPHAPEQALKHSCSGTKPT